MSYFILYFSIYLSKFSFIYVSYICFIYSPKRFTFSLTTGIFVILSISIIVILSFSFILSSSLLSISSSIRSNSSLDDLCFISLYIYLLFYQSLFLHLYYSFIYICMISQLLYNLKNNSYNQHN